jgi:hypothetical protein
MQGNAGEFRLTITHSPALFPLLLGVMKRRFLALLVIEKVLDRFHDDDQSFEITI